MAGHGGSRPGAGRPAGAVSQARRDLAEAARDYTDAALQVLRDVMADAATPPGARIAAAVAILDRGHGKPRQAVELAGDGGGPVQVLDYSKLSDSALRELLALSDAEARNA